MNAEERTAIKARAEAATEGPWEVGNRWHIQGADFCPCRPEWGPAIVQRMDINGKMMLAHRHRLPVPRERDTIYTEPWPDGYPRAVVITTSEYGAINRYDAEFIAHAREDIPALVAALEEAEAKLAAIGRLSDGANMGKIRVALATTTPMEAQA